MADAPISPPVPPEASAGRADAEAILALPAAERRKAIAKLRPMFGQWRALKAVYKLLEADPSRDPEALGELIGRVDNAPLSGRGDPPTMKFGRLNQLHHLSLTGNLLTIAYGETWGDRRMALWLLNPDNPLAPTALGQASVTSVQNAQTVIVGERAALLAEDSLSLFGPATGDDKSLTFLGAISVGPIGERGALAASRGIVYALAGAEGAKKLSVVRADRGAAWLVNTIAAENVSEIAADHDHLVALTGGVGFSWRSLPKAGGLAVYDINDPAAPREMSRLELKNARNVWMSNGFAVVGLAIDQGNVRSLQLVDLRDARHPKLRGSVTIDTYYGVEQVAGADGFLYVTGRYTPTLVLDIRDPDKPREVHRIATSGGGQSIGISDGWLYITGQWRETSIFSLANPEKPQAYGSPISAATIAYMKRRGRRALRRLAVSNAELYVRVAASALGQITGESLDSGRNWAAYEMVFGGGTRLAHHNHGRGRVVETTPAGWARRTREELAPDAWTNAPELARKLRVDPKRPWQIRALAARALAAAKAPPVALADTVAENDLRSPSALLVTQATRAIAGRLSGRGSVDARVAADAVRLAGSRTRRTVADAVVARANADAQWGADFVEALLGGLKYDGAGKKLPARTRANAEFVAERLAPFALGDAIARLAPSIFGVSERLRRFVLGAATRSDEESLYPWLMAASELGESDRELLVLALEDAVVTLDLKPNFASGLVRLADPFMRETAWRLIAVSATSAETLKALWDEVLAQPSLNALASTALASPYALRLLGRAGITADDLLSALDTRPFLVSALSADAFALLAQTLPGPTLVRLIGAATDDAWQRLRVGLLRTLQEGVNLGAFWTAIDGRIDDDPALVARVLDDPEISATLLSLDDPDIALAMRSSAMDSWLDAWLARHLETVATRDDWLGTAAIHPLPSVRARALERVATREFGLAFALRLVESELPQSVSAGRAWFDAENADHPSPIDRALALCDSPRASVRTIGREFISARLSELPLDTIAGALFENPDPIMQAFVASLGDASPVAPETLAAFDTEVLRQRHRARRAKEAVKRRQQTAQNEFAVETATLLALARSASSRDDADWALSQLVQRALAGEIIEGLEVTGVREQVTGDRLQRNAPGAVSSL